MLPLPLQTGAEVGVGLVDNGFRGVNWWLFAKTFTSWVGALVCAAFISAVFFALGE